MLAGVPVGSLPEAPLNRYFDVPTGILPEATAEYYQDPVLKASMLPRRLPAQQWVRFSNARLRQAGRHNRCERACRVHCRGLAGPRACLRSNLD